jgi:hypothetical protein
MSDDLPPAMRAPKITTNMTLSRKSWEWLKAQAADRSVRDGGQPSMAAVIEILIREKMST